MNNFFCWVCVVLCFVMSAGCLVAQYFQGGLWFVGTLFLLLVGMSGAEAIYKASNK